MYKNKGDKGTFCIATSRWCKCEIANKRIDQTEILEISHEMRHSIGQRTKLDGHETIALPTAQLFAEQTTIVWPVQFESYFAGNVSIYVNTRLSSKFQGYLFSPENLQTLLNQVWLERDCFFMKVIFAQNELTSPDNFV